MLQLHRYWAWVWLVAPVRRHGCCGCIRCRWLRTSAGALRRGRRSGRAVFRRRLCLQRWHGLELDIDACLGRFLLDSGKLGLVVLYDRRVIALQQLQGRVDGIGLCELRFQLLLVVIALRLVDAELVADCVVLCRRTRA